MKLIEQKISECLQSGDHEIFNYIVQKYEYMVRSFLSRYTKNKDDIDDAIQGMYLNIHKSRNYDPGYAFTTWLCTIAKNKLFDTWRKNKNMIIIDKMPLKNKNGEVVCDWIEVYPDNCLSIEDQFEVKSTLKNINKIIDELPMRDRAVIRCRFNLQLQYSEIADKLNMSLGTVKSVLFRTKQKIKHKLILNGYYN